MILEMATIFHATGWKDRITYTAVLCRVMISLSINNNNNVMVVDQAIGTVTCPPPPPPPPLFFFFLKKTFWPGGEADGSKYQGGAQVIMSL